MGIEATTSSSVSATSTQVVNTSSSKTNSTDSSFKDEMTKVTESENKKDSKTSDKESKNIKNEDKNNSKDKNLTSIKNESERNSIIKKDETNKLQASALINAQFSINDVNNMLSNDIAQMVENTASINNITSKCWSFGFGDDLSKTTLKMNESDADFFINLTQNENINVQSIHAQAQGMLNTGADVAEVKQNVQVSQALLDALSQARENNQPLRIDFDQNISVILRVGRDGAISAQFIPGDKAVEQYLRNNIDTLRNSFDEQELPYHELSYSHSSKEQNQRRRQQNQQGE